MAATVKKDKKKKAREEKRVKEEGSRTLILQ